MPNVSHKTLGITDMHAPHAFEFATAALREAGAGLVAEDVGKMAKQTDDNSLWFLAQITPAVLWSPASPGGLTSPIVPAIELVQAGVTDNVTEVKNGDQNSTVMVKANGDIYVLHRAEASNEAVLHCSNNSSGSWVDEVVDDLTSIDLGQRCEAVMDANEDIHVIYYDNVNGVALYKNNIGGDFTMTAEVVGLKTATYDTDIGKYGISIGLTAAGLPVFALGCRGTGGNVAHIGTRTRTGVNTYSPAADYTIADDGDGAGQNQLEFPSLVVDDNDDFHIICIGNTVDGDNSNTVRYNNNVGGSWNATPVTVDQYDTPSGDEPNTNETGLAIDSAGFLHAVYQRDWDAYYASNESGAWVPEALDLIADGGESMSIAIHSDDTIVVTQKDDMDASGYFHYKRNGVWSGQHEIDISCGNGGAGRLWAYASTQAGIAWDNDGNLLISYVKALKTDSIDGLYFATIALPDGTPNRSSMLRLYGDDLDGVRKELLRIEAIGQNRENFLGQGKVIIWQRDDEAPGGWIAILTTVGKNFQLIADLFVRGDLLVGGGLSVRGNTAFESQVECNARLYCNDRVEALVELRIPSETTANRPGHADGMVLVDETLNKVIFSIGGAWYDAMGTAV